MKQEFEAEYMRRLKLIMKLKLHCRNKIKAINTSAISLYGAGVIEQTQEDLQKMDRKARKVMTINKVIQLDLMFQERKAAEVPSVAKNT